MTLHRICIFLALFATLALPAADASNLVSSHRLAVIGGTRPTLVAETGSFSGTATTTRTVSITPPVGTSLLVVYAGAMRVSAHSGFDLSSLTFNGTAMTQLTTPTTDSVNRTFDVIAYRMNPTTGVSQDIVLTSTGSVAWNGSMIYAWAFSGTDTSDPFGQTGSSNPPNVQSISHTFQPEYGRPYMVGGSVKASSGGGGNCYTGTNLTISAQGRDDSDDIAGAAAVNSTLTGAGSTTFTMFCSFNASGGMSFEIAEVKGP